MPLQGRGGDSQRRQERLAEMSNWARLKNANRVLLSTTLWRGLEMVTTTLLVYLHGFKGGDHT